MRSRVVIVLVLVWLTTACGGDAVAPIATTTSIPVDRVGGAVFTGTFDTEAGAGATEITITLDATGDRIVNVLIYDSSVFTCPNGASFPVGWSHGLSSTPYTPIDDANSFELDELRGVFDSSIEAHGTYDFQSDCSDSYVLDWRATSQ